MVAKVKVDGHSFSQLLLKEVLAVAYDGRIKFKDWCVLGTEEYVLVWNTSLVWAAAQRFTIMLSG